MADMSDLEGAFCLLMCTFNKYAGDDNKLDKRELKELLSAQMPHLVEGVNKEELDGIFKGLDADESGFVEFHEYMTLMAGFACLCHSIAQSLMEENKKMEQQCKK